MFISTLLTDTSSLLFGRGKMEGEGIAAPRCAKKNNRPVAEEFIHAECVPIELRSTVVVGDKKVDVANPSRTHGSLGNRRCRSVCSTLHELCLRPELGVHPQPPLRIHAPAPHPQQSTAPDSTKKEPAMRCGDLPAGFHQGTGENGLGREGFSIAAQRKASVRHIRDQGCTPVDE